jgi:molybdenum cofactor biosynthesis protein B
VDTVSGLLSRELNGFGELFRRLSYDEIGVPAMFSRAKMGIAEGKIVVCLPGSKGAMRTALKEILLPSLGHLLWEVNR